MSESAAESEVESRDDAQLTEAQQEQAGVSQDKPSDEAKQVAKEDAEWRADNPNQARTRDAKENVGGESFAYLDVTSDH